MNENDNKGSEPQNLTESNPLLDIIQNLQGKLGTNNSEQNTVNNSALNNNTINTGSSELNLNTISELLKNVGILLYLTKLPKFLGYNLSLPFVAT